MNKQAPRLDLLEQLANYLESPAVTEENFHMGYWKSTYPSCGTVACAIGHACSLPEWQAIGLVLEHDSRNILKPVLYKGGQLDSEDFYAVSNALNIDIEEAEELFAAKYDEGYRSPRLIAARLRQFIEEKRADDTSLSQADPG